MAQVRPYFCQRGQSLGSSRSIDLIPIALGRFAQVVQGDLAVAPAADRVVDVSFELGGLWSARPTAAGIFQAAAAARPPPSDDSIAARRVRRDSHCKGLQFQTERQSRRQFSKPPVSPNFLSPASGCPFFAASALLSAGRLAAWGLDVSQLRPAGDGAVLNIPSSHLSGREILPNQVGGGAGRRVAQVNQLPLIERCRTHELAQPQAPPLLETSHAPTAPVL